MNVRVRVKANARREKFEIISGVSFAVAVREKAKGNAANHRVREVVAMHFKVPSNAVRIVSGHRSSSKRLLIST